MLMPRCKPPQQHLSRGPTPLAKSAPSTSPASATHSVRAWTKSLLRSRKRPAWPSGCRKWCRSACPSTASTPLPRSPRPTSSPRPLVRRSSFASPSVLLRASRLGTTRCTRLLPRLPTQWPLAAPWCSSPAKSLRSMRSSWPRSSTRSACLQVCSTSCRALAPWWARQCRCTQPSTWCRSLVQLAPESA